jgi:hypothetical protein
MVFPSEQLIATFTGWDIQDPEIDAELANRLLLAIIATKCPVNVRCVRRAGSTASCPGSAGSHHCPSTTRSSRIARKPGMFEREQLCTRPNGKMGLNK